MLMKIVRIISARFRRRVKVEITCPHGGFTPRTYRLGRAHLYDCKDCEFQVRIWTDRGEVVE